MKRILTGLACLALATSATAQVAARHGMDGAGYQQEFNQFGAQGYRLKHVDGYSTPQGMRYAAIWLKSASSRPWIARHGVNGGQFQNYFNDYLGQGYRLMDVSVADGGVFAGLWEKGGGPAWESRAGLNIQAVQAYYQSMSGKGFRPIDIEGYQDGGTKFAIIWTQNTDKRGWYMFSELTHDGFQQKFNEMQAQGFRPIHVDGYATPGGARFAAIWERASNAYVVRHGMTHDGYQQQWNEQNSNGFKLTDVSGYVDNGVVKYAAIWEK